MTKTELNKLVDAITAQVIERMSQVHVDTPKQTSPKQKGRAKATRKADAKPATVTQSVDFDDALTLAAREIVANKSRTVNVNLIERMACDTDPRIFLSPKGSGAFRRAYKRAGIHRNVAVTQLSEALAQSGWAFPTKVLAKRGLV